MRKIRTLFQRDPRDRRHVIPDLVTPGCEWVLAGEGVATRKWDGTCVLLDEDGAWWARREVRPGKTPPPGWREVDHDDTTGRRVGWEPIERSGFATFHAEAVADPPWGPEPRRPWTYELVGPRVNGNPDGLGRHTLIRHGETVVSPPLVGDPLSVVEVAWQREWEGIVWWRDPDDPDCDKVKLKVRDLPEVAA